MSKDTEDARAQGAPRPLLIDDYPVREYLASMSLELATMARRDGDGRLAALFDVAAEIARLPPMLPQDAAN